MKSPKTIIKKLSRNPNLGTHAQTCQLQTQQKAEGGTRCKELQRPAGTSCDSVFSCASLGKLSKSTT